MGWRLSSSRDQLTEEFPADLMPSLALRRKQFDLPVAFRRLEDEAFFGANPALEGWVASPGSKVPLPVLTSVRIEIAWWCGVLAYVLLGSLTLIGWQRRKASLLKGERSSLVMMRRLRDGPEADGRTLDVFQMPDTPSDHDGLLTRKMDSRQRPAPSTQLSGHKSGGQNLSAA